MLSYFPAGTLPDETELDNGAQHNPDGHGWAIVDAKHKRLSMRKSMDAEEAIDTFLAARKDNASGPALFHSRIATSGLVDVTGVHPFRVGQDTRTVVGHNGILFNPGRDSLKSDTRIFAEVMLPRFGSIDREKKMRKLEKFCGRGNKLVILTVNPSHRRHGYIVNESAGYWSSKSGAWHSNSDYLYAPKTFYYSYSYKDWGEGASVQSTAGLWSPADEKPDSGMSPWPCIYCGCFNCVDKVTEICEECRTCNGCNLDAANCMCYSPGRNWESPVNNVTTLKPRPLAVEAPKPCEVKCAVTPNRLWCTTHADFSDTESGPCLALLEPVQ